MHMCIMLHVIRKAYFLTGRNNEKTFMITNDKYGFNSYTKANMDSKKY